MENIKSNYFILLLVFIFTIILSSNKQFLFINVTYLILCSIMLIRNRSLLLMLFVSTLPTNGFISTEYNLFDFLHVTYIIHTFSFVALYIERNKVSHYLLTIRKNKQNVSRYAYYFTWIVFLYLTLNEFRFYILGQNDISFTLLLTRTVRYIFMFGSLLVLIRLSVFERFKEIIKDGFLISVVLLSISVIFGGYLSDLGIETRDASSIGNSSYVRRAGILALGDENTTAGYLAIAFTYLLFSKDKYIRIIRIFLIFLILMALIGAGSRTSFLSISIIFTYYFLIGKTKAKERLFFSIGILTFAIFVYYWDILDPILNRFKRLSNEEASHLDSKYELGRIGGWLFYLDFILSDWKIFLFGSAKSIYVSKGWTSVAYERVAHNYFIQLWYYWGIFPLGLLILNLIRYIKYSMKTYFKELKLALIVPFLLTLMFVSDVGVFLGLILALTAINDSNQYSMK